MKDKVLIDYQMVSALFPTIVIGSTVGVMLNIMLPEVIQTVLFALLVFMVSYTTLRKACKLFRAESKAKKAKIEDEKRMTER